MSSFDLELQEVIGLQVLLTAASLNLLRNNNMDQPVDLNNIFSEEDLWTAVNHFLLTGRNSLLPLINDDPMYIAGDMLNMNTRDVDNVDIKVWKYYHDIYTYISSNAISAKLACDVGEYLSRRTLIETDVDEKLVHMGTYDNKWAL